MNNENLGEMIRRARERLGWTQTQLAQRIGVTASFITKVEKDEAVPSYDRLIALGNVLVLETTTLIALSQRKKDERVEQRIRTRGAIARSAYRLEGTGPALGPEGTARLPNTAEQIGKEILDDPDLQATFNWLRTILANPELKNIVLKTLETFAKQAQP